MAATKPLYTYVMITKPCRTHQKFNCSCTLVHFVNYRKENLRHFSPHLFLQQAKKRVIIVSFALMLHLHLIDVVPV